MPKIFRPVYFLTLLGFFCLPNTRGLCQQMAPSVLWKKSLGGSKEDRAYSVTNAHDGGFIIAGSSKSNDGDVTGHHGSPDSSDAWVVKISESGNLEWQRSFGGTGNDEFTTVLRTSDGSYLCFGLTTSNNGDVSGLPGEKDIWLVKLSRTGVLLWQKTFGGSSDEIPGNIISLKDGNYYVIGSTFSNDGDVSGNHSVAFRPDIWVLKIDPSGNILWKRCFGGSNFDQGFDIVETENDSFIIGAEIDSDDGDFGTGGGNSPRGYIVKIDSTRKMVWKLLQQRSSPQAIKKLALNEYVVKYDLNNCVPLNPNNGIAISAFTNVSGSVSPPALSHPARYATCAGLSSPNFNYTAKGANSISVIVTTIVDFTNAVTITATNSTGGGITHFSLLQKTGISTISCKLRGQAGYSAFIRVT